MTKWRHWCVFGCASKSEETIRSTFHGTFSSGAHSIWCLAWCIELSSNMGLRVSEKDDLPWSGMCSSDSEVLGTTLMAPFSDSTLSLSETITAGMWSSGRWSHSVAGDQRGGLLLGLGMLATCSSVSAIGATPTALTADLTLPTLLVEHSPSLFLNWCCMVHPHCCPSPTPLHLWRHQPCHLSCPSGPSELCSLSWWGSPSSAISSSHIRVRLDSESHILMLDSCPYSHHVRYSVMSKYSSDKTKRVVIRCVMVSIMTARLWRGCLAVSQLSYQTIPTHPQALGTSCHQIEGPYYTSKYS